MDKVIYPHYTIYLWLDEREELDPTGKLEARVICVVNSIISTLTSFTGVGHIGEHTTGDRKMAKTLELAFIGLILAIFVAYLFIKKSSSTLISGSTPPISGSTPSSINLSLSLGGNNTSISDVYYIQPDMSGYYTCGMQGVGGNQTVRYTWILKAKANPPIACTVFLEINYFDTNSKSYVTPFSTYTKQWVLTLDQNGEATQEFQDCLVPHSVRAESSVGVKVIKVELPSGQTISFNSNTITLIPQ